ncbi:MAG: penicillin-binding protein 1B [Steroidobacteraceae bacterium]
MKARTKKLLKKYRPFALGAFGLVLLALTIWIFTLDRQIRQQFEGRRWTLPAKVYAQPLELYAGQALTVDELQRELDRLGYQRSARITRTGNYQRSDSRIDLVSRPFRFADENRAQQTVSIRFDGNRIERLWDAKGQDVPVFRMDPLLIGSIYPTQGEDRIIVTPQETPALLPATLKIVEDRRFDSHFGVDPLGIMRALWTNIRSSSGPLQGGSTLTQQLVRSYFLNNRQTFSRKITEAMMAILLEVHFTKDDLMNAYINEINLAQEGSRAIQGFGLASQYYFGKPLAELQLHEIALLVTEVRSSSYYNPRKRPERALARRNLILDLMAKFNLVKQEEADRAKAKPLGLVSSAGTRSVYYPAFLDYVRRTLRRDYQESDLTEAGLTVFSTLDPYVQAKAETALVSELQRLDKNTKRKDVDLEGAVVVTSPSNGEVQAIVGGRNVSYSGFNRALDAKRNMGSLAKPVVYLTGIESGQFNAASILKDEPVTIKLDNKKTWSPQNYDRTTNGPVPAVRALAQSLNLATVDLGMQVGVKKIAKAFASLGMNEAPQAVPSMLLGGFSVTPVEVAQVYTTLASGGFRTPLRAVRAVIDEQGKELKAFPVEVTAVADPTAVYQVQRMMVEVMRRGTGASAASKLGGLVVAGKSGTSSDYRDSWFAGFSGNHVLITWVGYDDNEPTRFTGSTGALPIWIQIMSGINGTSWDQPLPEGLTETQIDFMTGQGVNDSCAGTTGLTIAVPNGTEIPLREGCTAPNAGVAARAGNWLRGIMGK